MNEIVSRSNGLNLAMDLAWRDNWKDGSLAYVGLIGKDRSFVISIRSDNGDYSIVIVSIDESAIDVQTMFKLGKIIEHPVYATYYDQWLQHKGRQKK